MSSGSSSVLSLSHTQAQTQPTEKSTKNNEWDRPLSKSSSFSLSPRSLEICTECLGSEAWSGIDSNYEHETDYCKKQTASSRKTRERWPKKAKPMASFPPPLTSIGGIECVQVESHREGGRLVIKAFNYTSCGGFLRAERGNGRLRLSYFRRSVAVESEEDEGESNANGAEGGFGGLFWGENGEEESGILGWPSSNIIRCNDDCNNGSKRIPSIPFCVAIS